MTARRCLPALTRAALCVAAALAALPASADPDPDRTPATSAKAAAPAADSASTPAAPAGAAAPTPGADALATEIIPRPAEPAQAAPSQAEAPAPSKKAERLAAKRAAPGMSAAERARWQRQLKRRLGRPADAPINVRNRWTRETLPVHAAEDGADQIPAETINRFFRCHFTNEPTKLDRTLFRHLIAAARHFGVHRIQIISAYRAPKFNLILRKKGREVARNSQHSLGAAIDFRLPGVAAKRLHAWVKKQGLGGVGWYPHSKFIHMDTGPVRYWSGR